LARDESCMECNSFSLEYELHGCECCVLNTTASCSIKEDKAVLIWFPLACLYMPLLWHCLYFWRPHIDRLHFKIPVFPILATHLMWWQQGRNIFS
jgi:hypothetical protein